MGAVTFRGRKITFRHSNYPHHGKPTGSQVDAVIESAVDREHHMTFEVGRRLDWAFVEQNAADFAAGLES